MMHGKCHLCLNDDELRCSHIIPKFVFSRFKRTTPGFYRSVDKPNLRIQDGLKEYLLCADCENRFSKWETIFAERIFYPIHENENNPFSLSYEDWALKFAISVSWRSLVFHSLKDGLPHFSDKQLNLSDKALKYWNEFLLGRRTKLGQFEQHLIILGPVTDHNIHHFELSPFINRYFMRAIDSDIICSKNSALVYNKMGKIIIFGFIQMPNRKKWKGSKLHLNSGVLGKTGYHLPMNIIEYINNRANVVAQAFANMSLKQKNKIESMMWENLDEISESEAFYAMHHDVLLSGHKAFDITKNKDEE